MNTEPSRIVTLLTAAVASTIGVLTLTGVWTAEVGGAVGIAVGAWIVVAGEIIRSRVTPNDRVALTVDDVDRLEAAGPPLVP